MQVMRESWHRRFCRRYERRALRDIRRNTDAKRQGILNAGKRARLPKELGRVRQREKGGTGLLDFEAVFLTWAESDPIMDRHEREH